MNIKKIYIYVPLALLLFFNPKAYAEESWLSSVKVNYKAVYASKYMWRGIDLQDDEPAFQSDVFCDFGSTGLYAGVFYSTPLDGRDVWKKWDEFDWYVGYYHTLCPEKKYSVDCDFGFTHYYFPRIARESDTQDVMLSLKLPNALPFGDSNLVPRVKVYYGWSPFSDANDGIWVGVAALYDYTLPSVIGFQENQKLSMKVETYHNDGGQSFETVPGWGYVMATLGTSCKWKGVQFTPEINYQWSLGDKVNYEDECWFSLSVAKDIR